MSNMNNIDETEIIAFAKDYAELCKKHGLYLVFNDDVWLQGSSDFQDLAEVEENLIDAILESDGSQFNFPDQWTQEEIDNVTIENEPALVFNQIRPYCDYLKGMEIQKKNGTISDANCRLLEFLRLEDIAFKFRKRAILNINAGKLTNTGEV